MKQPAYSMTPPDDSEVVARIARGELDPLGTLFDRYERVVKRFIGRLGVAAADVDDLVQSTFLDVPAAAIRFDPRWAAKTWLLGLAAMVVRRHRRSAQRHAARLRAWALEPWKRAAPEHDVEQQDAARRAVVALERLAHKKREVFVMLVFEDLSGDEAARALGVPVATVWTRMHHARRDLRKLLKERVQ
jgi:RNA polymerase sigma-70 factor (ECF subfamily)